jgi:SAM-dependent methyltransferase
VADDESPPLGDGQHGGVFDAVREGYDAVYGALAAGETFARLWRTHAYRDEFPEEYAHIGFLTLGEAERLRGLLALHAGDVLADVACGAGGPGLWMSAQTGASLIGLDPSDAGVAAARDRARRLGAERTSRFAAGSFASTGLADRSVDAVMSIEAFHYAPDKRAAIAELARILRPHGRVAVVCFEVDPAAVAGVPILGVDPVPDYAPLFEAAGFTVETYEETPGWRARVDGAFGAIVDARDALVAEMGEEAAGAAITEATLTLELRPYPRRVLLVARRHGQAEHWESTFVAHPLMYGTEPSEAAVEAAHLFASDGAKRVLELGAGQGRDTLFLAREGFDVVALDYAASGLASIAAQAAAAGIGERVQVLRHDARQGFPFADESVDASYSHMLFSMALTTEELERLAREVRRVLRPGGLAVYTVRHVGDAHFGAGTPYGDDMYEHGGFVVHFFDRALVDRLADGFELLDVAEFSEGDLPRRLWRVTMRKPGPQ